MKLGRDESFRLAFVVILVVLVLVIVAEGERSGWLRLQS